MAINWITADEYIAEPWEKHGTAKESWANDKISCDVVLYCPWADRYAVLRNILKHAKPWPYHTTPVCRAVTGSIAPFVAKADTEPEAGLTYELAEIGVHFETAGAGESGEGENVVIYSEELTPSAEFITLAWEDFRWGSYDGDAIKQEEAPGRLIRGLNYSVTWFNLPTIPTTLLTAAGAVNDDVVVSPSLGLSFAAETLLFQPGSASRSVSSEGDNRYQVKVGWSWRPSGWNRFWRAATEDYEEIYHVDGGGSAYKNFPLEDFGSLVP